MALTPTEIVRKMLRGDVFSQWLGIEPLSIKLGEVTVRMKVREEMLDGFKVAHGAISFALAESALAFAANTHGQKAVSIETSIKHLTPVQVGDWLTAHAVEESFGHRIAHYRVEIANQEGEKTAVFSGTVYRPTEEWQ
jgi:acyl-CoA thioesterase